MNKGMNHSAIDSGINITNYQILLKGIWTGVLISLILHHLIIH